MPTEFKLDFVGIGTAKSGTTWLAQCLAEHPEICLSKPKELHYFRQSSFRNLKTSYALGEEWMSSHFKHCQPGQKRGEYSVFYHFDPASPRLIYQHNPNVKLIIAFRNPTERLLSLYYVMAANYELPLTFDQFVAEDIEFKATGLYVNQMKWWFDTFPRDSFHIIFYDDIAQRPETVICELFAFLGVDADYRPNSLEQRVNMRKEVRSHLVRNLISRATDLLNHTPQLHWLLLLQRRLGLNRIRNWLAHANTRPATSAYQPMSSETRAHLIDFYAESNLRLAELLGVDLGHWNR